MEFNPTENKRFFLNRHSTDKKYFLNLNNSTEILKANAKTHNKNSPRKKNPMEITGIGRINTKTLSSKTLEVI